MRINLSTRHWLMLSIGVLFVGYCLFQARYLILGPEVWIDAPRDGEAVTNPMVIISGHVRNAAWLSLNDRQIFTDEEGYWNEKLIVAQGLSIMTLKVRDRFGREKEKSVRILLN